MRIVGNFQPGRKPATSPEGTGDQFRAIKTSRINRTRSIQSVRFNPFDSKGRAAGGSRDRMISYRPSLARTLTRRVLDGGHFRLRWASRVRAGHAALLSWIQECLIKH